MQLHWILACHAERRFIPTKSVVEIPFLILFRMVPIGSYYLGASSTSRGIINPEFKFPPLSPSTSPAASYTVHEPGALMGVLLLFNLIFRGEVHPHGDGDQSSMKGDRKQDDEASSRPAVVTPSSIEVPAPPVVEKERTATRASVLDDSADDDVGDTVDIPLN